MVGLPRLDAATSNTLAKHLNCSVNRQEDYHPKRQRNWQPKEQPAKKAIGDDHFKASLRHKRQGYRESVDCEAQSVFSLSITVDKPIGVTLDPHPGTVE